MRTSLGTLLVQNGVASDQDVKKAIEEGQQTGEPLGELVVRKGLASDKDVAKLLAEQWELRYADADEFQVDEVAALRISREEAGRLGATPIAYDGDTIVMAVVEPRAELFAHVAQQIGEASYLVVSRSTFEQLIGGPLPSRRSDNNGWHATETSPATNSGVEDHPDTGSNGDQAEVSEVDEVAGPDVEATGYVPSEPIETAFESIDSALEECERLHEIGTMLSKALPQLRERLAGQHAALAALDEVRKRDSRTIQELESEVSRQGDLLEALRGQAAALAATFDEASR